MHSRIARLIARRRADIAAPKCLWCRAPLGLDVTPPACCSPGCLRASQKRLSLDAEDSKIEAAWQRMFAKTDRSLYGRRD